MPGLDHEMPIALIHNRPETALELLHVATGTPIPPFTAARVGSMQLATMVTAKRLEEMVTTIQDFEHLGEKYFSHWLAKGEGDAILNVLEARGLEVPDDVRERIHQCQDLDQLRTWVRRAVTVTSAHELFTE
ncbi:hypothetical protein [Microbispora sp. H10670]|uniref:hypothetical protein n=1 Tax=Microbispora sp. H10670 TaxID=2729108 RepID=UPI0021761520|nr:hypothetical protein [Microbispora sp. H10670]